MSFEPKPENMNIGPAPGSVGSRNGHQLSLDPKTDASASGGVTEGELKERVDSVLTSDIAISTLLTRLKQSISSARELSTFLKERSNLEDRHSQGLKRLSRSTFDALQRSEQRQGSFATSYEEVTKINDQIAEHGIQYASNLHSMSEELVELAAVTEKGRKYWKQVGLNAEKKVQDAELALEKAKNKYHASADQYDRARTGERQGGKFGLKGSKNPAQQEEDLFRKAEMADNDYAVKVQVAQATRTENDTTHRKQSVNALSDLIMECDAGVGMQLSKYAMLTERLTLGTGLCISPLRPANLPTGAPGPRGLRDIAQAVDNKKDLNEYIASFSSQTPTKPPDIKYEKHPALAPRQQQQTQMSMQQPYQPQGQFAPPGRSNTGFTSFDHNRTPSLSGNYPPQYQNQMGSPPNQFPNNSQPQFQQYNSSAPQIPPYDSMSRGGYDANFKPDGFGNDGRTTPNMGQPRPDRTSTQSQGPAMGAGNFPQAGPGGPLNSAPLTPPTGVRDQRMVSGGLPGGPGGPSGMGGAPNYGSPNFQGGPAGRGNPMGPNQGYNGPQMTQSTELSSAGRGGPPVQSVYPPPGQPNDGYRPQAAQSGPGGNMGPNQARANTPNGQRRSDMHRPSLPPTKPVFGVTLDELFRRDGSAVPTIIYQCVQAVDLFGLDTEGIYRTSGSAPHIMEMKALFDHDSSQVDFRNPSNFHHDIASVTTLLKHFLRDLPDPLLTGAQYNAFISASKIDDDVVRRDSLHAIINALPDPNYATLRVLTLHLNRVAKHSNNNKMTPNNLAICLGPTLMGQQGGGPAAEIRDAGWQARVVETILNSALEIFDDDE